MVDIPPCAWYTGREGHVNFSITDDAERGASGPASFMCRSGLSIVAIVPVKSLGTGGINQCGSGRSIAGYRYSVGIAGRRI